MKARLLEMRRKTVAEPFAIGRPPLLVLLERAIDHLYTKHEAAARDLSVSPGQLSKWLSGKERFALVDLDRCRPLKLEVVRLLAVECGFDVRSVEASEQRRRRIHSLQGELLELMAEERAAS